MSEIIPFDSSKRLPAVELSNDARDYIKHSARPNTRRAYAAQLKQWLAWCEALNVQPFPSDPASVANYLAERAGAGQCVSTLRTVVAAIKAGHSAQGLAFDTQAPEIAKRYWNLPDTATLRDVVLVVRADEAHHRDVNHGFASELGGLPVEKAKIAPSPYHETGIKIAA